VLLKSTLLNPKMGRRPSRLSTLLFPDLAACVHTALPCRLPCLDYKGIICARQGEWEKAIIYTAEGDSHHHSGRGHSSCDDPHLQAEFRRRMDRRRRGHFGGWLFGGEGIWEVGRKRSER
jgi:hypothetical protein